MYFGYLLYVYPDIHYCNFIITTSGVKNFIPLFGMTLCICNIFYQTYFIGQFDHPDFNFELAYFPAAKLFQILFAYNKVSLFINVVYCVYVVCASKNCFVIALKIDQQANDVAYYICVAN